MIRSVGAILCALKLFAPGFEPKVEAASHIRLLSSLHAHDPYTLIGLVQLESGWNPSAVNSKSGAAGLGQVMPASEDDARALLDWHVNLTRTSSLFASWREYCRDRVGSALFVHWAQGYGGFDLVNKTTCGHRRVGRRWVSAPVPAYVTKVLGKRRELVRRCQ